MSNGLAETERQQRVSQTTVNTYYISLGLDDFIINNYFSGIHIDLKNFKSVRNVTLNCAHLLV